MDLFARGVHQAGRSCGQSRALSEAQLLKAWRSIGRRLMLLVRAVACQSCSDAYLHLAGISPLEAAQQRVKVERTVMKTGLAKKDAPAGVSWARGRALAPYKGGKAKDCQPSACDHPENRLLDGGNGKMFYTTCLKCHSRWERVPLQPKPKPQRINEEEATVDPEDLIPLSLTPPPCPDHGTASVCAGRGPVTGSLCWMCSVPACKFTTAITHEGFTFETRPVPMES